MNYKIQILFEFIEFHLTKSGENPAGPGNFLTLELQIIEFLLFFCKEFDFRGLRTSDLSFFISSCITDI